MLSCWSIHNNPNRANLFSIVSEYFCNLIKAIKEEEKSYQFCKSSALPFSLETDWDSIQFYFWKAFYSRIEMERGNEGIQNSNNALLKRLFLWLPHIHFTFFSFCVWTGKLKAYINIWKTHENLENSQCMLTYLYSLQC